MPLDDTLITTEANNLPPELAPLVDPAQSIPASVTFFEKRFTINDLISTAGCAFGLAFAGLIVTPFGVAVLFDRKPTVGNSGSSSDFWLLGFGVVLLFAAWFMAGSVRNGYKSMRRQQNGESIRLGIFVTPDALMEVTDMGYTVIGRAQFRGLAANTLRYLYKGQEKSVRLPGTLVGADNSALHAAIERWAADPAHTSHEVPKPSGYDL